MKIQNIVVIILALTLFIFISLAINVGVSFQKQYKKDIEYFAEQDKLGSARVDKVDEGLVRLSASLDGLNARLAAYDKTLVSIKEKIDSLEAGKQGILSTVDKANKEMADLQAHYSSVLKELKDWTENVRVNIEAIKKELSKKSIEEVKKVDLGKIVCGSSK